VTDTVHAAQAGKIRGTGMEWLSYAGDKASSKYSPLAQIDKDNFNRLRVAWTWRSAEEEIAKANHPKLGFGKLLR
jgi:glucose dehydrogenase